MSPATNSSALEQLIAKNIPRDVFMACEDAYHTGDAKGRAHAASFAKGHRPSAAGHSKHFFINESFYEALLAHGGGPSPLRGTQLVIGRLGIFNVARLNVPKHKWVHLRRSATRKTLAELNRTIELKYVQDDLFAKAVAPVGGTIFILGVMDGLDENGISKLTQVLLALPAPDMKSWLYIKPVSTFLDLYEQPDIVVQRDTALPILKKQPKKLPGNDQRN